MATGLPIAGSTAADYSTPSLASILRYPTGNPTFGRSVPRDENSGAGSLLRDSERRLHGGGRMRNS